MNLFINLKYRQIFIFTLRLGALLSLGGLFATTAGAVDAAGTSGAVSTMTTAPFSKLQFDRNGQLYGLGPQQKTLFRIQVKKTGIATQQLITRKDAISGFATGDDGFLVVDKDSAWMLDRAGKDGQRIGGEKQPGRLDQPTAVAYSSNHRIYIAESGSDRVSVFGRDGIYLFSFGDTGDRATRLKNPFAIFVDQGEMAYVLDERDNGRVSIYSSDGQRVRSLTANDMQLAPFSDEHEVAPVIDQRGTLLAVGSGNNSLVVYDWRHNKRQKVDRLTASRVRAFALDRDQVVTEEDGVVHTYKVEEFSPAIEQAPVLDNVTGKTIPAPDCNQASVLPAGEMLCLNRKQGSVTRYSADGKAQVRYGGALPDPSMLASNNNRVAVVDKKGLQVYQLSGRLIYRHDQFRHLQALDFAGDRLVLIDDGKLVVLDAQGSVVDRGNARPVSSISSRTRFLATDSLQNLFTADRRDNRVHVDDLQSGESETISRPEITRIFALAVDGNDQLYILAKHRDGGRYVHVYRGMLQRFSFLAGHDGGAAGFSVLPSADTLISLYSERSATLRQFQYQQVPSRTINLQARPEADAVTLTWLRAAEPFVNQYNVEAAESVGGPFTEVATTKSNRLRIRLGNTHGTRNRYFRVSAIARSMIRGLPSGVLDNRFEAGYRAYREKNFLAAIDNFRRLLAEEPENAAAMEFLGRSLIEVGQYDRALPVLHQLQARDDYVTTAKLLHAEALFRAGRLAQAKETLAGLQGKRKNDPEQLKLCGRIYLALNDSKRAQGCLNRLVKVKSGDAEARLMLLRTFDNTRQRSAINSQLSWFRNKSIQDNDPGLMTMLANYLLDRGKFKDANSWFQRALKIKPGYLDARTGLIRMAEKQKQFSKARSIALAMIGSADQQVEGYRQLGSVALHQDRPGEAVLSLRKAASLDASNMEVQLTLAKAFGKLKNYSQAKQSLSNVLQANPVSEEAHFAMAQAHLAEGEDQAAIRDLYRVLQYQPQNIEARELLVNALETSGQLHAATSQALTLNLQSPTSIHTRKLADLYYRQGRMRLALAQYRKLLSKHRNSVELNVIVGTIYHQIGQDVLARKVLEKAVRLNRRSESAQTVLAQVYRNLNLYKSALRSANTAYKLNASADNRLLLESIKSDHKAHLKTRKTGTTLVVDKFRLVPVYSTALSDEKVDIGSLGIANRSSRDIKNISMRVYVGDFVDAGMTLTIPVLKAKSSENIPLKINLSSHIGELSEDQIKHVDVELGFSDVRGAHLIEKHAILSIYGKHAADWNSSLSLQRFLQGSITLATQPEIQSDDETKTGEKLPEYLSRLVDAYSTTLDYGIAIVAAQDSERRYLQYPVETLTRRRGTTADLGMLFCSVLVSKGNRVAVAGSVEHPLVLLSTGISWEQRSSLEMRDAVFFNHEGQAWIPLALGQWANGIAPMWSAGSSFVSTAQDKIVVHELRPGSKASSKTMVVDRASPDGVWTGWYRQQQSYSLQSYLMARNAQEIEPVSSLKQARWYFDNRYYRHAIKSFGDVLQENPYSYDALIGIGDAYGALGNPGAALDFYRRASYLEPFDKTSLNKVSGMARQLGENPRRANPD